MAKYSITEPHEGIALYKGEVIFKLQITPYEKNPDGIVIFDGREVTLQDCIIAAGKEFSAVPWELLWVRPYLRINDDDGIALSPAPAPVFWEIDGTLQCMADSFQSLLHLIRMAEQMPNCDLNCVRFKKGTGHLMLVREKQKTPK